MKTSVKIKLTFMTWQDIMQYNIVTKINVC